MVIKKKNLRYPLSLISDETDYLSINVLKYTPAGIKSSTPGAKFLLNTTSSLAQAQNALKNIEGNILLPMPVNLADRNGVDWDGSKIDPIAAAAFETVSQVVADLKLDDGDTNAFEKIGKALGNLKGAAGEAYAALTPEVREAIKNRLIAGAVNQFNANINPADIVSRTTGQVLNPNLELTFKGVQLRQFDFTFKLTPRSLREGQEVKAIINTFKRRMAPKTSPTPNAASAGVFLQAPDIFALEFKKGRSKHPFLFSMKPCALKNMTVNYADGAPYSTYYDGTPVSMDMKLSFKELNPIYAEDYSAPEAGDGVGF